MKRIHPVRRWLIRGIAVSLTVGIIVNFTMPSAAGAVIISLSCGIIGGFWASRKLKHDLIDAEWQKINEKSKS